MKKIRIILMILLAFALFGCSAIAINTGNNFYSGARNSRLIYTAQGTRTVANRNRDQRSILAQEIPDRQNQEQREIASLPAGRNISSPQSRADAIAEKVGFMDGIAESVAALSGGTVIVGISLENAIIDDNGLLAVKRRVENEVMKFDAGIHHVSVTTDPELIRRISEL